jgi:hypothetical protein
MSPVPTNRAAPPPATRTTTPKDRRPATRTGTPPAAVPVKRARSPLLWALPVLALGGVAAWLVLGRGTPSQPPASPPGAAAPVETVKVVERSPAETVRLSSAPATAPDQPSTPSETRSTTSATVRSNPGSKTAYAIEAARAIARRVRATSAGATTQELSAGDADAAAAEALARDGKYGEATARLASAIERWNSAAVAAQGRPRRGGGGGGGGGQGLRGEAEQVAAEFADAFSAKSLPRIRVVFPRMTEAQAQEWGQLFMGIRDVSMQLRATDANRTGPAEMQASFSGSYDYTDMQGGTAGSRAVSWQATLRQGPMGWRIVALR